MDISPPTFQRANYISSVEMRGGIYITSTTPILTGECEGQDLGVVGGALSIVTLDTTTANPQTYLVDG